jgi:carboxypeptidase family protein
VKPVRRISWLLLLFLALNAVAFAQAPKKDTQLRSVRGVVADKDEKPVPNAVVFLKNLRTNTVISHFSDDEGNYRFTGLDPNVDYEVFAELDGLKSATRTVSALDSRKEITLNLKVDRKNG